ncbi:MAG: host-nuclease inhibitor Gam family protein [Sphingomonas phyllosphaerae]
MSSAPAANRFALRDNATLEKATPLLERFAQLGYEIAAAETARNKQIAETNAVADAIVAPLVQERERLRASIEPWWRRTGFGMLPGKRKTMELLGCIIGSKSGRSKLMIPGDDEAAVKALKAYRWGKDFIRVTEAVDKAAVGAALKGKNGDRLRAMGFYTSTPGEEFVLEAGEQQGTAGNAAAA